MAISRLALATLTSLVGSPLLTRAGSDVTPTPFIPGSPASASLLDPTGDTFGTVVGGFKEDAFWDLAEGVAISEAASEQVFPTMNATIGNNAFYPDPEPILFTATSAPGPGPNQLTITFEWRMQNGLELVPSGANIDGEPVYGIGFEVGTQNALGDGLRLGHPFTFDHPALFPETHPELFYAPLEFFDTKGETFASGPWFVVSVRSENEFSGRSGLTVATGNLAGLNLGGARAQVTITAVPEPATFTLVVVGGALILRYNRRHCSTSTFASVNV